MATKDVILKKKIGNVIYDLMVKTTAAMVQYDSSQTLSAYLSTLATTVANSAATLADLTGDDTSKNIAGMIAAAIAELEDATDPNSFESRIAANAAAISAINDATTGILATQTMGCGTRRLSITPTRVTRRSTSTLPLSS